MSFRNWKLVRSELNVSNSKCDKVCNHVCTCNISWISLAARGGRGSRLKVALETWKRFQDLRDRPKLSSRQEFWDLSRLCHAVGRGLGPQMRGAGG